MNGEQIGYVKADLAARIACGKFYGGKLDEMIAKVANVTGGTPEKPTLGINLAIGVPYPVLRATINVGEGATSRVEGESLMSKDGRFAMSTQDVRVANVYRGKNLQIYGVIAILVGLIVMASSWPSNFDESFVGFGFGLSLLAVGFVLAAAGKAKHWYHAE